MTEAAEPAAPAEPEYTVTQGEDATGTMTEGTFSGTISAETTMEAKAAFVNTRKQKPVFITLSATKYVVPDAQGPLDGTYTFAFDLTAAGDNPESDPVKAEGGRIQKTVQFTPENYEAKQILFEKLKFTEPGTYKYTLKEEATPQPDIVYDGTVYNITVEVTPELDADGKFTGSLVAKVTVDGEDKTTTPNVTQDGNEYAIEVGEFVNKYKPGATSAVLEGTKELRGDGVKLEEGQFTFVLTPIQKREQAPANTIDEGDGDTGDEPDGDTSGDTNGDANGDANGDTGDENNGTPSGDPSGNENNGTPSGDPSDGENNGTPGENTPAPEGSENGGSNEGTTPPEGPIEPAALRFGTGALVLYAPTGSGPEVQPDGAPADGDGSEGQSDDGADPGDGTGDETDPNGQLGEGEGDEGSDDPDGDGTTDPGDGDGDNTDPDDPDSQPGEGEDEGNDDPDEGDPNNTNGEFGPYMPPAPKATTGISRTGARPWRSSPTARTRAKRAV